VLTSVHAFANDPARGKFILCILVAAIGGALGLYAWRAPKLESGSAFQPVSRESALLLNNVLLSAAAATVFLGTLYPLFLEAIAGTRISVGPPYFALTFAPLAAALLVLVPFGPQLAWRRGNLGAALRVLAPGLGAAVIAGAAALAIGAPRSFSAAACVALALWVIAASVADIGAKMRAGVLSLRSCASAIAHAGLGVTLLGVAGTTLWKSESLQVLAPGQMVQVGGYALTFDGVTEIAGPNYRAARATVAVRRGGEAVGTLTPEVRSYPVEGQTVSKTAIRTTGYSDLYVALGDNRGQGRWMIRAYVNPFAPFIWFGGGLMALGGLAAFFARVPVRFHRFVLAPAE
jgi:cytochrome c-type biogenesis protein CcmF